MHRFSPDRLTDKQLQKLAKRYRAGESVASLARDTGYTWHGIHAALKRVGVEFVGHGLGSGNKIKPDDPRAVEAFKLRDAGMGYVRASAEAGLSSAAFRRLLIESGRDPQARWKGEGAPNWKGGRQRTAQGYVRVDAAEFAESMGGTRGTVLEHRLVMARHLGRPLTHSETVHHKNGKRDDNRVNNLQLRSGKHGNGQALRCAECGSTRIVSAELLN